MPGLRPYIIVQRGEMWGMEFHTREDIQQVTARIPVEFSELDMESLGLLLSAVDAYIWDCVTLPEFRRKGLFSALINHMAREIQKDGGNKVWIGANKENQPSLKGFKKAGYQPAIGVLFIQVLGLRFFKIDTLPNAPQRLVKSACEAFDTGHAVKWAAKGC